MRSSFIIAISFLFISAIQSPKIDTNAKIKTMFIYNFTKYIEWPSSYKQGNFVIGMLGESPLYGNLKKMSASKKAVTQTFKIQKFNSISEVSKCHILILSKDVNGKLPDAISKVKAFSTLIITEGQGLARKGSAINFTVQNNKQRFELNKANISKYNLKVSQNLISLAIEVS